jgi:hypothetical protein
MFAAMGKTVTIENKTAEKCGVYQAGFEPATSALRSRNQDFCASLARARYTWFFEWSARTLSVGLTT